ncbi:ornithine cyclodeaminase family protein [Sphingobium subterraneum]|uniref:Ornithine cyclodeaminase n=1 Tax=Sphingobium subterraneum TaxID=627688 RepID=A0A841IXM6_9SPHN|nr:ornithine cyclodeaminase family protein [Sphingobium subterraneum]MBB6123413.1 ornithine cyclodeaminase [Sphingobium subterraneum]
MSDKSGEFRVLDKAAIASALPMSECIDLMKETMETVSRRRIEMPLRMIMPVPGSDSHLGIMPGYIESPQVWGTKLICLVPENPKRGLSSHTGVVLLYDVETGQLRALLDAAAITALRTPAATAAASRVLARPDATSLAILGTGEQAHGHFEALELVHRPTRIFIWGRSREAATQFRDAVAPATRATVTVCETVEEAVREADVVCSVTAATDPIIEGRWIAPGTHVNLVGSSIPAKSEIDADGVAQARYFVDYRPSAEAQAGELKRAIAAGVVTLDHILGEIGDVHLGLCPGRTDDRDITIYKSLGVSAQDLTTSQRIYEAACARDLGQKAAL